MMKRAFYIILFLLSAICVCADKIDATNEAIAKSLPGDYIIRENGEIVVLKQIDIDYAKEQLGLNTIQNGTHVQTPNKSSSIFSPFPLILFIIITIIFLMRRIIKKTKYPKKVYPPAFNKSLPYKDNTNNKKTYIDQKGYRRFIDTDIFVHRYLAEKKIGRKLRPGEIVHHINRNKLDNSPENLQIFSNQEEHDKVHKESGWY